MPTPQKILLVEDDRTTSSILRKFLSASGYNVFESAKGRLAIKIALRERPDLMLVDIMLPDMQGSEVVQELQASDFGSDLKAVFLSSLISGTEDQTREGELLVGGVRYAALPKPINPELIAEVVERSIAGEDDWN